MHLELTHTLKDFYLVLKNDEIIVSRNILNSVVEVSP